MQEGTARVRPDGPHHGRPSSRTRLPGFRTWSYLRHPTTGGVFASWGSLGHVSVGEPGALVGFLGPKVYAALYGEPTSHAVYRRAENLLRTRSSGRCPAAAPAGRTSPREPLTVLMPLDEPRVPARADRGDPAAGRPAGLGFHRASPGVPIAPGCGSCCGSPRPTWYRCPGTGPGRTAGRPAIGADPVLRIRSCVLLGQDRSHCRPADSLAGAGRTPGRTRRGMRLAAELQLPLVSVIDTPGAALSQEAEEEAWSGRRDRPLPRRSRGTVRRRPSAYCWDRDRVGRPLALLPADRVIAARHAWLAPAATRGGQRDRARRGCHRFRTRRLAAATTRSVPSICCARGIVDARIVPGVRTRRRREPAAFSRRLGAALAHGARCGLVDLLPTALRSDAAGRPVPLDLTRVASARRPSEVDASR